MDKIQQAINVLISTAGFCVLCVMLYCIVKLIW